MKIVLTSPISLQESWGPLGVQGPHLWELLCLSLPTPHGVEMLKHQGWLERSPRRQHCRLMTSCQHCTPKDQSTDVSRGCVSLGLNPRKKRNCWCLGFLSAKGKSMWRSEGHGKTLNDGIYQNVFGPSEDISEVVCILYS